MVKQKAQRLISPKISSKDEKEYSVIELPNGLTALVISDVKNLQFSDTCNISKSKDHDSLLPDLNPLSLNETTKTTRKLDAENHSESATTVEDGGIYSASDEDSNEHLAGVALTINVGSFSDPADVPGLAHFMQHMVLLGSEKYPTENYFSAYLDVIGGRNGAFTRNEHTTFFFECPEEHLEEAVDIFSQCFVSPLLKEDAMTYASEAVEFQFQAVRSDGYTPLKQFIGSLAASDNPYGKFQSGNRQTLEDNLSGDHLHSSLVEFWRRHYSAQ